MKKNLIVVLIVLASLVVPALSQDVAQFQVNPKSANLWYFHSPNQGLNYYFMTNWPNGTLLTKFGLPAFKLGKLGTVQIAVGPDLNLAAKGTKELVSSWTADVTPVISAFGITGAFVNEAGLDRDGKGIWFLRHTVTKDGFGLRWSGCGQFGGKTVFFRIGPTIQLGKIQLWIAEDQVNGGLTGEISFRVKL
jgi:hypothetical protein